jgi:hypothetical protein
MRLRGAAGAVVLLISASRVVACTRPVDLVASATDGGVDAATDAPVDGAFVDRPEAAPSQEAGPTPRVACPKTANVMLITTTGELLSFDPRTDTLASLGPITCLEVGTLDPVALATSDDGSVFVLDRSAVIIYLPPGTSDACKVWNKAAEPPIPNGGGLAIVGSTDPAFVLGVAPRFYRASATTPDGLWTSLPGTLDPADHTRALLGTGDGRLFAVVEPSTKGAYRLTSIDEKGASGATFYVPTPFGIDPTTDGAFALWGAQLLVFTQKGVERFDFATGLVEDPVIVPFPVPPAAAAAPPCASTL